MSFTDRTQTNVDPRLIQHGWDVYGADGEKVGDVSEVSTGYLVVSKGFFFPKERYVPTSAITRIEHDRVYLNLTKADLDADRWDTAPETTETHETGRGFDTGTAGERTRAGLGTTGNRGRTEDERTVQLREEELRANKDMRQTGEVELRKEVREEQRTIDVPVTREEVTIERHPVDRKPSDRPIGEGETIRVPVREEQVTVEKRPVVTEEVSVGKRPVTETEHVTDTVRREELRTEREGDVGVGGDWSRVSPDFRTGWQSRHGTSGRTWEQDEPSYRYGYEMANDPRYRDRQWTEVESDLGRDWGTRYGRHGAWEQAKANAREAWDTARGRR
jgi:uncharacterized protein (TIGR02271 family)